LAGLTRARVINETERYPALDLFPRPLEKMSGAAATHSPSLYGHSFFLQKKLRRHNQLSAHSDYQIQPYKILRLHPVLNSNNASLAKTQLFA
jgi:hypothetical protein